MTGLRLRQPLHLVKFDPTVGAHSALVADLLELAGKYVLGESADELRARDIPSDTTFLFGRGHRERDVCFLGLQDTLVTDRDPMRYGAKYFSVGTPCPTGSISTTNWQACLSLEDAVAVPHRDVVECNESWHERGVADRV